MALTHSPWWQGCSRESISTLARSHYNRKHLEEPLLFQQRAVLPSDSHGLGKHTDSPRRAN
jgi:hypothetical protein